MNNEIVTFQATLKWNEEYQQWLLDNPIGYFDTIKTFLNPLKEEDNYYKITIIAHKGTITDRPKHTLNVILRWNEYHKKWLLLKDILDVPPFMFDFVDTVAGFWDCLNTRKVWLKPDRDKPNEYIVTIKKRNNE